MDQTALPAIQKAFELIRAGKQQEAQAILAPLVKANPNFAEAWYLLGLTLTDSQRRLYAFQQVLRIDPANQAAQKQISRLQTAQPVTPVAKTPSVQPFTTEDITEEPLPETFSRLVPVISPKPVPAISQKPDSVAHPKADSVISPKNVPVTASELPGKKTKRAFPVKLAITLVAVVVMIGGLVSYLGYGMNRNQQVGALFLANNCAEVVQFDNFEKVFPRAWFSSFFGVYEQIDECRAQLAVEQAVSAQDWSLAYTKIEDYLTKYPNGAFATEMNNQAGEVLFAWSKNLVAQKDYSAAIEKLKLLQDKYPSSKVAVTALDAMFSDYILWAQDFLAQKNYATAEQYLILVSSHGLASAGQVQRANQELGKFYLQWADAQVASGDFDKGLKHYERARDFGPGLADYDRLIDHVTLLQALALAEAADFDRALEKARKVADASQAEEIKAEALAAQTKILDGYAHSNAEQARAQMATTIGKACSQQPPALPIFGLDTEKIRFGMQAPFGLQLPLDWTASTPAELHYVLCASESEVIIQSCPYIGGHTLRRKRYVWAIELYSLVTEQLYQTTKLEGSAPRKCLQTEYFMVGSTTTDVYGNRPTIEQIIDWLTGLKITP